MLGTNPLAVIARMTRSAMLEVLGEDYIRTARAKGLSTLRVVALHALRNALIPVVTVIGLQVGVLFTGAILTETIFSWPGVGKWLIEAISRRDYPVLQGGMLLLGGDGDGGQPAGGPDLRRHQPAHPATETHDMPPTAMPIAMAAAAQPPPRPAARVLELLQRQPRRRGRPGDRRRACCCWPLFAPWLAPLPARPDQQHRVPARRRSWQAGGSSAYLLGTDAIGRDILSRLIHGARLSLVIGMAVVALSVVVGIVLGLIAGFARGVSEIAIMRLMDIILTLPSLLLAIVIVAILGPGLMNAMLAVAVVVLPHYVRITRAAVIAEIVEGLRHRRAHERRRPRCA